MLLSSHAPQKFSPVTGHGLEKAGHGRNGPSGVSLSLSLSLFPSLPTFSLLSLPIIVMAMSLCSSDDHHQHIMIITILIIIIIIITVVTIIITIIIMITVVNVAACHLDILNCWAHCASTAAVDAQ
jgi:hypothetical protein